MKNEIVHTIENQFLAYSEKHQFFQAVETIVLAVSGGVDSMVMAYLLEKFKRKNNYKIALAHFNHLYRGSLAYQDENLVREFAQKNKIQFYVDRCNVKEYAEKNKISFEMAGRRLRYQFFNKIAAKYKYSKIATAHIADDHSETILMRLVKGTGLRGVTGIDAARDNIIHPMLFASKKQLYDYAGVRKIPFNDDHTNFEPDCTRNIIRNKVIPIIRKEINPSLDTTLDNFSEIVRETQIYIEKNARQIYEKLYNCDNNYTIRFNINEIGQLPSVLRREVLLNAFKSLDTAIQRFPAYHFMVKIDHLILESSTGKYIQPFPDILVQRDRGCLLVIDKRKVEWEEEKINPEQIYHTDSFILSSKFIKFDDFDSTNYSSNIEYLDADKIKGTLRLKHWQKGDKFVPFGNQNHKKLSDFFIDEKLALIRKKHQPVLWDDQKIIWVCGMRLSDEVKITRETKKILKLEYKEK